MKRAVLLVVFSLCAADACYSQSADRRIRVSEDIEVIRISEHAYMHMSWSEIPPWGRVESNGLICVSDGEALLLDTPTSDSLTKILADWITDSLKVRIVGFVPNHWHDDCMGGLRCLHEIGIPSYAQEKTLAIAESKNLPVPKHSFADSLTLHFGREDLVCRYFGGGHTADNIVCWIPSDSVLFGGCMVKDSRSTSLGNIADADLSAWPSTIAHVLAAYPHARVVIPGHGTAGGVELLTHTQALLNKTE